jgi:hypothetical protein
MMRMKRSTEASRPDIKQPQAGGIKAYKHRLRKLDEKKG